MWDRKTASRVCLAGGFVTCCLAGCMIMGCTPQQATTAPEQTTVVLTFDDGPLAADVPRKDRVAAGETLLGPLRQILVVLQRRRAQGVFYVAAPMDDRLTATWTEGVMAIHSASQILGYHAFQHDALFWIDPFSDRTATRERINADYDHLQAFIDQAFAPTGLSQHDVFSPIFRMPFGDGLDDQSDGPVIARQRSWTCHGYAINSLDSTVNADAPRILDNLLLARTHGDPVALVLDRLSHVRRDTDNRRFFDVLMHVNSLTAAHLDEWIDTLIAAFGTGDAAPVTLATPPAYLADTDPAIDLSWVWLLVFGGGGTGSTEP